MFRFLIALLALVPLLASADATIPTKDIAGAHEQWLGCLQNFAWFSSRPFGSAEGDTRESAGGAGEI